MTQKIDLPRMVEFGNAAIQELPKICKSLRVKNVLVVSGSSTTNEITKKIILPLIPNEITFSHITLQESNFVDVVNNYNKMVKEQKDTYIIGVGGGKIIDYVKVIASFAKSNFIAIPTNSSHDGFANPYINNSLLKTVQSKFKKEYIPTTALAIIGDTKLISTEPVKFISAGVGDMLAKWIAIKDWQLANRIKGEPYDVYAATFSLMTAKMVANSVRELGEKFLSEDGIRVLIKAQGSSGVAMGIAGSSRPASGSEHLISHALDRLSQQYDFKALHGHQCGLASVLMMYFHQGDWQYLKQILKEVNAPVTLKELGIDEDILIEAVKIAPDIRKDRYTILSSGVTKEALLTAIGEIGLV